MDGSFSKQNAESTNAASCLVSRSASKYRLKYTSAPTGSPPDHAAPRTLWTLSGHSSKPWTATCAPRLQRHALFALHVSAMHPRSSSRTPAETQTSSHLHPGPRGTGLPVETMAAEHPPLTSQRGTAQARSAEDTPRRPAPLLTCRTLPRHQLSGSAES